MVVEHAIFLLVDCYSCWILNSLCYSFPKSHYFHVNLFRHWLHWFLIGGYWELKEVLFFFPNYRIFLIRNVYCFCHYFLIVLLRFQFPVWCVRWSQSLLVKVSILNLFWKVSSWSSLSSLSSLSNFQNHPHLILTIIESTIFSWQRFISMIFIWLVDPFYPLVSHRLRLCWIFTSN